MKKFHEYLSSKGKVDATPIVKAVADVVDIPKDRAKKPPKEAGRPNNAQPYTPDGKKVVRGGNKGLGDHGDRNLVYDVTKKPSASTIITAESFEHHELFPKIQRVLSNNPQLIENLVHTLKQTGLLGILVGEMLSHNETYQHIAEVMSSKNHGYGVCKKLAKAMHEDVASPMHLAGQEDPNAPLNQDPAMDDEFSDDEEDEFPSLNIGGDDEEEGNLEELPDDEDDDIFSDEDEDGDPNAPPPDPNALPMDPNAPPPDPNALPMDPNAPPPDPNMPPHMRRPAPLPPAMENMRRAWNTVLESYKN